MPFHVLLLPGGHLSSRDGEHDHKNGSSAEDSGRNGDSKDYLFLRHEFRKKKTSKRRANHNSNDSQNTSGEGNGSTDGPSLQSMASPLEIALAKCCEHLPSATDGSGNQAPTQSTASHHTHRSRLHRPVCPSNYESGPEPSAPNQESDQKYCASPSKHSGKNPPTKSGVLLHGKEGHFAALVGMHCPSSAVGHRSLALAILQRTVDWEAVNDTKIAKAAEVDDMHQTRLEHVVKKDDNEEADSNGDKANDESSRETETATGKSVTDKCNERPQLAVPESTETVDKHADIGDNYEKLTNLDETSAPDFREEEASVCGIEGKSSCVQNESCDNHAYSDSVGLEKLLPVDTTTSVKAENVAIDVHGPKITNPVDFGAKGLCEGESFIGGKDGGSSCEQNERHDIAASDDVELKKLPENTTLAETETSFNATESPNLKESVDYTITVMEETKVQSLRIKSFLAAGGMKILARWLVESFSPVPSSATNIQRKPSSSTSRLGPELVASPTGALLLPLLHLLKSIPFDKEIVLASQINKCIKRLKKALDSLIAQTEMDVLKDSEDGKQLLLKKRLIENTVHPIAGGQSVGKVMAAVEKLMNTWKKAAVATDSISNNDGSKNISITTEFDPFQKLRIQIQSQFDELAVFQNEKGEPPSWLPRSVMGILSSPASVKLISNIHLAILANAKCDLTKKEPIPCKADSEERIRKLEAELCASQKAAKVAREKRTLEELLSKRRKGPSEVIPRVKRIKTVSLSKKVAWADRPNRSGVSPQPLTEERIFEKDQIDEDVNGQNSAESDEQNHLFGDIQIKEEGTNNPHEDSDLENMCLDSTWK